MSLRSLFKSDVGSSNKYIFTFLLHKTRAKESNFPCPPLGLYPFGPIHTHAQP